MVTASVWWGDLGPHHSLVPKPGRRRRPGSPTLPASGALRKMSPLSQTLQTGPPPGRWGMSLPGPGPWALAGGKFVAERVHSSGSERELRPCPGTAGPALGCGWYLGRHSCPWPIWNNLSTGGGRGGQRVETQLRKLPTESA